MPCFFSIKVNRLLNKFWDFIICYPKIYNFFVFVYQNSLIYLRNKKLDFSWKKEKKKKKNPKILIFLCKNFFLFLCQIYVKFFLTSKNIFFFSKFWYRFVKSFLSRSVFLKKLLFFSKKVHLCLKIFLYQIRFLPSIPSSNKKIRIRSRKTPKKQEQHTWQILFFKGKVGES